MKETLTKFQVEKVECRSIQLQEAITLKGGVQTKFIKAGDQVLVRHGQIVPCYGENSTHIVVGLFGTVYSTNIEIALFDIDSCETITIKL